MLLPQAQARAQSQAQVQTPIQPQRAPTREELERHGRRLKMAQVGGAQFRFYEWRKPLLVWHTST